MWELYHKEGWALKNWCFLTVMFEKTLESPLDLMEIKPVSTKGNESKIIYLKNRYWSRSSNTLATWCEELTHWKKTLMLGKIEAGGEGDDRGWDGWMASLTNGNEFEQTPGDSEGQESLVCCSPWGCSQTWLSDWTNKQMGGSCFVKFMQKKVDRTVGPCNVGAKTETLT